LYLPTTSLSLSFEGLALFWRPRRLELEFESKKIEWMTSRDEPTFDSRRITRSLARALASRTNGAMKRTNVASVSQRSSVRRAGVTLAGSNALRRAANLISQDPSVSVGAQVAAQNILRESEEDNARIVPPTTYDDEGFFTGQWTVYLGLDNDSEDESATLGDNSVVMEGACTRRTTSTPPTDQSWASNCLRCHEDLTRWLDLSPSSERGTTRRTKPQSAETDSCARPVPNLVRLRRPRRT
jgi:hypothetical protein